MAGTLPNEQRVALWLNQGNGSFAPPSFVPGLGSPWSIDSADLNGDSHADLVVADVYPGAAVVSLGHGDGTFDAPLSIPSGWMTSAVRVGDMTNDGKLDLLVVPHQQTQNGPKEVKYLAGDGTGSFAAPVSVPLECAPTFVALGRINSDDNLDLAASCVDGRVLTMAGNGDGTFFLLWIGSGISYGPLVLSDMDADGVLDLATADDTYVRILSGTGSGGMKLSKTFNLPASYYSLRGADMNGDGATDLLLSTQNDSVSIITSNCAPPPSLP